MYDMRNLQKFNRLAVLAPEAFKAFVEFDEAVVRGGVIPLKYKELIAVAVALTTQCPYCIDIHSEGRARPEPPNRSWPKRPCSPPHFAREAR